ncbi:MAG: hypothetical protein ABS59_12545 [Methylobacterium sp. SCN 67-24]|nr:MAG: hypothetical protein ABS59_12545 [Methylobacterium sp. SCN 67-24]
MILNAHHGKGLPLFADHRDFPMAHEYLLRRTTPKRFISAPRMKASELYVRHTPLVDIEPRSDARVQLPRRYAEVDFNSLVKGEFVGR